MYVLYGNHDENKLHVYFKQNISATVFFSCLQYHITNVHYFSVTYKFEMKFSKDDLKRIQ